MSPRSISEIPGMGKMSTIKVETALNKTMSKDVSNKKSVTKTNMITYKDSIRSDLMDVDISMADVKPVDQVGPPSPANSY